MAKPAAALELNPENVSEAFGFAVPEAVVGMVRAARALNPAEPHTAFSPLSINLGGPLYPFVLGQPISLRERETPPELFPFASIEPSGRGCWGLVADHPEACRGEELEVARLGPEEADCCRVVAASLPDFLALRAARALEEAPGEEERQAVERVLEALGEELNLPWPVDPEAMVRAAAEHRRSRLSYATDDGLGVVVPEENAPFELLTVEIRRTLIDRRDRSRVREAGRRALKLQAPGACLALARDLIWTLGTRPAWFQSAVELMEQAYLALGRRLLARVARREWARHYRQGR